MKENARQSITKLREIYISAQKNYKRPRQLKINNIHKPIKKKKKLHVRIIHNYAVKSETYGKK